MLNFDKKGARLDVISNGMTVTDLAVTTNQPEIITKIPPDKIVIGKKNRNNYVYFARVVKLYDTGKTDARIIDALLKQGFISEKHLEEIRTILKNTMNFTLYYKNKKFLTSATMLRFLWRKYVFKFT